MASGASQAIEWRWGMLRSERYFGAVARSFQLPVDVDATQAKAKYDNGVLTLTLPKKQGNKTQRLMID